MNSTDLEKLACGPKTRLTTDGVQHFYDTGIYKFIVLDAEHHFKNPESPTGFEVLQNNGTPDLWISRGCYLLKGTDANALACDFLSQELSLKDGLEREIELASKAFHDVVYEASFVLLTVIRNVNETIKNKINLHAQYYPKTLEALAEFDQMRWSVVTTLFDEYRKNTKPNNKS